MNAAHFFTRSLRDHGIIFCLALAAICFGACRANDAPHKNAQGAAEMPAADVVSVSADGEPKAYDFSVGVSSPDRGCDQYADWWEVLSLEGKLIYRRILLHSHVDEQPFARSGGPVPISSDDIIFVRAHMHPGGYGGAVFTGSVTNGFRESELDIAFAANVESDPPQPGDCRF